LVGTDFLAYKKAQENIDDAYKIWEIEFFEIEKQDLIKF